jgi:hypothetical protein
MPTIPALRMAVPNVCRMSDAGTRARPGLMSKPAPNSKTAILGSA